MSTTRVRNPCDVYTIAWLLAHYFTTAIGGEAARSEQQPSRDSTLSNAVLREVVAVDGLAGEIDETYGGIPS